MNLKKLVIALMIMACFRSAPVLAQEEEIQPEDQQIIAVLDILENLQILQEDLDLLDNMSALGDENEK